MHFGITNTVWVATEEPTVETEYTRRADGSPDPDTWQVWPAEIRRWLRQDYQEAEARIGLGSNDGRGGQDVYLTLTEAAGQRAQRRIQPQALWRLLALRRQRPAAAVRLTYGAPTGAQLPQRASPGAKRGQRKD